VGKCPETGALLNHWSSYTFTNIIYHILLIMIYGESLKYNQRNLLVQWFINIQYIDKFLTYALRFQIFNKQWNLRKFGTLIKSTKYGPNFEYVYNHRNLLLDLKAELVLKLQQSCYFFIW
jgi:hypothetical protein